MRRFFGISLTALAVVSMALSVMAFTASAAPVSGNGPDCTTHPDNPNCVTPDPDECEDGSTGDCNGVPDQPPGDPDPNPNGCQHGEPDCEPTATVEPTIEPTEEPTSEPTSEPTPEVTPTREPTQPPCDPAACPEVTPTPTRERDNPPDDGPAKTGGGWGAFGLALMALSFASGAGGIKLLRRRGN